MRTTPFAQSRKKQGKEGQGSPPPPFEQAFLAPSGLAGSQLRGAAPRQGSGAAPQAQAGLFAATAGSVACAVVAAAGLWLKSKEGYSFPLQKPLSPTPPRPRATPRKGPETDPKQTRSFEAKSGNLNLFLGILLFFPLFSLQFSRKKGQNTQKKV